MLVLVALFSIASPEPAPSTQSVYDRYRAGVFQIRIVEKTSGSKTSLGTGFFVSPEGYAITNYHVVSEIAREPSFYSAEMVRPESGSAGEPEKLDVLAVDIINDLAIVKAPLLSEHWFALDPEDPKHGERLYSLGNPLDLGTAIVEATYNGLIEKSLYEKIHLTGSINPGMSGGPTIKADGKVVGVNVATAGNQVSFLVPAKFARALYDDVVATGPTRPDGLIDEITDELLDNQDEVTGLFLETSTRSVDLGPYRASAGSDAFQKCWGQTDRRKDRLYEVTTYSCETEDDVFISEQHRTGIVLLTHTLLSTSVLNRFRFYALYEDTFGDVQPGVSSDKEDVSPYRCETKFTRQKDLPLKVVFCARAYRKLPGLYDATIVVATLDAKDHGLVSELELDGFSFENAVRIAKRHVESFTWAK